MAVVHRDELLLEGALVRPRPVANLDRLALLHLGLTQPLPSLGAALAAHKVVDEELRVAGPRALLGEFLAGRGAIRIHRVICVDVASHRVRDVLVRCRARALSAIAPQVNLVRREAKRRVDGQRGRRRPLLDPLARLRILHARCVRFFAGLHVQALADDARLLLNPRAPKLGLVRAVDALPAISAVAVLALTAPRKARPRLLGRRRRRRRCRVRVLLRLHTPRTRRW
mmetsp:Transcript_18719/g.48212  ORF Transcript_18719/g.48212 Transcript_18719/m.48212 type:complete len:227 (+) Transcript_18719:527-1207(+)